MKRQLPLLGLMNAVRRPAGKVRPASLMGQERPIAGLLLLFAVAFNLYYLYPEVAVQAPPLNDGVLHYMALGRSVEVLASGQDPTDFWLGTIGLGYPLFHHYQHLAYLPPAALRILAGGRLSLLDLFNGTRCLLLSLFPLSVYWSMRRFGFSRLVGALGGLVAPLLATDGLYGLDFASYVWRGYGMYTQLWGMLLLPLALAQGYTVLRRGRGYFWAVLLLAATLLSHLVLGYIALLSQALFAVLSSPVQRAVNSAVHPLSGPPPQGGGGNSRGPGWTGGWGLRLQRGSRLALLLALVAVVTAYFWIPYLRDGAYMNRSVWEQPGKYDSYGYEWALGALVKGELFDFGRLPVLTLLAAVGLATCLWRWREERYRIPVALFIAWLLLYLGRPTWGALLDLLPLSRDLHLHRLIAGVHLGGIFLMGLALALPWRWALSRREARWLLGPAALMVLLLAPVYKERAAYLGQNARWMRESRAALGAEEGDLETLAASLRALPPGRVYAGLAANWGRDYQVGALPMYALLQREGFDMLGYLYHALSLNADIQVLFDERRPEHYDLFNVRYVVAPADRAMPDFLRPVETYGRHRLYLAATSGYFDLVGTEMTFSGDKEDFFPAASGWLAGDLPSAKRNPAVSFSGLRTAEGPLLLLSQGVGVLAQTTAQAGPSRGKVVAERIESGAYQAQVEVARESTLMLKVTFHPNWRASVDGIRAETVMVMPSYVGVRLTPGTHDVLMEYHPRLLRYVLWIAGLLALPLIAIAEGRRGKLAGLMALLNRAPVSAP